MAQLQGPYDVVNPVSGGFDGIYMNFRAAVALTKGQVVVLGLDGITVTTTTTPQDVLVVGVVAANAVAGGPVSVLVYGVANGVSAEASVAAGEVVSTGSTAGACMDFGSADIAGATLGVALTAVAGGVCRVFVKPG